MPTRNASAKWEGNLKNGKGIMKLESGAFEGKYSFASRFEDGQGSNPEELIGAALSGCFSMALAGNLEAGGFTPKNIQTSAKVKIEKVEDGFKITTIDLHTEAQVSDIDKNKFVELAEKTKSSCPVSKALTGVKISLQADLIQ
jgi:osmotically inducible protein OsmC